MAVKRGWHGPGLWAAVGLVLAAGIVVLANVLAGSHAVRLDVTSTGRLALSPRSELVLEGARAGSEVVLAADVSGRTRSPVAVRRVLDVLDEIGRSSERVSVSVIDTSSAGGQASFEALVRRLAARDGGAIAAAESGVRSSLAELVTAAERLEGFAGDLESLRGRVGGPGASELAQRASRLRVTAEQVGPMTEHVEGLLSREVAGERLPDLPEARRLLVESADAVRTLLRVTANQLTALSGDAALDEETQNRAVGVGSRLTDAAADLGAASASLQSRSMPSVVRVVGALSSSEALLVLGSGGEAAAISMDDLFPAVAPGAPASDPGRRAETLVTNALATLGAAVGPMVVVTHAGTSRVLAGGADGPMASLRRRSGLRGVEWVEWPVAMEPDAPGAIAAAAADGRPVVYVVIGIDTSAQGGADRAARAASVLESLLDRGERVMVNLAPSTLPGLGEADPMADAIEAIGLRADTGRPVLAETRRGSDRLVAFEQVLVGGGGSGLAESVRGLAVALPWPIVIGSDTAEASAVLSLPAGGERWREGEWLGYWVTPAQQRDLLIEKPAPGGTRDAGIDGGVVAWAVDRTDAGRVLVVGSHLWMFDAVSDRPTVVDGRVVQQNPGNAELFLSGVEWLAGNDELLGRSAASLETPTVQPIASGRLSLLRWLLAGGLPVGVLLVGVAVRVVGG